MADFTIDPATTALIVQDLQNDVIIEGGAFADSGSPEHAQEQNVVENVKSLAAAARAAGIPVIHVHYIVEKGAPGLKLNAPLFEGVKDTNALVRGSWGAGPAGGGGPCGRGRGSRPCSRAADATRSSSPVPGRTCPSSTRPARAPTRGSSWSCRR